MNPMWIFIDLGDTLSGDGKELIYLDLGYPGLEGFFQTHTSNFKFQVLTKIVFRHSISQIFLGICCLID